MDNSDKSRQSSTAGQFLQNRGRLGSAGFYIAEIYIEIFKDKGCGHVTENSTSQANCRISVRASLETNLGSVDENELYSP